MCLPVAAGIELEPSCTPGCEGGRGDGSLETSDGREGATRFPPRKCGYGRNDRAAVGRSLLFSHVPRADCGPRARGLGAVRTATEPRHFGRRRRLEQLSFWQRTDGSIDGAASPDENTT